MIGARTFAVSISWIALLAPLACAADLSSYREFQFGMKVPAVVKQLGMNPSEVKVLHQRPALIQDLDWQSGRYPGASRDADPVKNIVFSFYNGELFRMVVNYDRNKTEGLTAEDIAAAISAKYGAATRPDAEIVYPSIFNESVKVVARWEDPEYSFNLVRSSYQTEFAIVMYSKRLDASVRTAITEALRLDEQEAPQREADLQKKHEAENLAKEAKSRLANKATFRP
jgi:hypothetical protein